MISFTSPQEQHRGEKGCQAAPIDENVAVTSSHSNDRGGSRREGKQHIGEQASRGGVEEQINSMDAMTSSQRRGKKI